MLQPSCEPVRQIAVHTRSCSKQSPVRGLDVLESFAPVYCSSAGVQNMPYQECNLIICLLFLAKADKAAASCAASVLAWAQINKSGHTSTAEDDVKTTLDSEVIAFACRAVRGATR